MARITNPSGNHLIRDLFSNGSRIPSSEYLFTGEFTQFLHGVQPVTVLVCTTDMQNGIGERWTNPEKFRNILRTFIQKLTDQTSGTRILHLCSKQSYLIRLSGLNYLKNQEQNM